MSRLRSGLSPTSQLIARLGLAAVFLYASISAFINPDDWIGFIPQTVADLSPLPKATLLNVHSLLELVLGGLLIIGWKPKLLGLLAALDLAAILIFYGLDTTTFRDIGLIALALTLVF